MRLALSPHLLRSNITAALFPAALPAFDQTRRPAASAVHVLVVIITFAPPVAGSIPWIACSSGDEIARRLAVICSLCVTISGRRLRWPPSGRAACPRSRAAPWIRIAARRPMTRPAGHWRTPRAAAECGRARGRAAARATSAQRGRRPWPRHRRPSWLPARRPPAWPPRRSDRRCTGPWASSSASSSISGPTPTSSISRTSIRPRAMTLSTIS